MKRRFVFKEGNSNKFWTVQCAGTTLTTVYGRVGSAGSATTKEYSSEAECLAAAEDLIRQKSKKGYKEEQFEGEPGSGDLGISDFWNLIERARKRCEGDPETQASILVEQLVQRPVEDILAFGRTFEQLDSRSYTSDLWAAAYIIMGGCSDDSFDYFRGWLIARGEDTFENTLRNPESLLRIVGAEETEELQAESMLSVAAMAYEEKTGKDDYYTVIGKMQPRPEMKLDWEEERESLAKKFPRLVQKFWPE